MSKFIDNVKHEFGHGRAAPGFIKPFNVQAAISMEPIAFENRLSYTISLTYSHMGYCERKDAEPLMNNFIKCLKREVYGEFINGLYRLEQAMYDQDMDKMRSAMRDILTEVEA